ncbi:DnaJ domain-containing protein [Parasphaerochaeta coccoides]|uniref:Heat shock protein DnaJ domain protein n=1 Tax=Parasphaerochaeta coccoides (strain ATCC BAA-1237 / DSM 17374 / SPN1) TaxID=760011 RepID=F4GM68_PARC1|nr:DnaJ domain-containing protein [Parasphaerochaeta coccoides]AEC03044.1 heat shock protein DnaJ domain protein [Parasphaerochaeta coccoides DSM 17374]
MGWFGKIIGGMFGWLVGGPLGLVAGIAFGHAMDKASDSESDHDASAGTHSHHSPFQVFSSMRGHEERSRLIFFVAAFSMLARIATSDDDKVSDAEYRKVLDFINGDLQLDPYSKTYALRVFQAALKTEGSFEDFAHQFKQNFSTQEGLLLLMMDILYRVCTADGTPGRRAMEMLGSAERIFSIPADIRESLRARYLHGTGSKSHGASHTTFSSDSKPYEILNITSQATDEEVRKAYRALSREFHPDMIASKGLPPEFSKFAEAKFLEIQEAYEEIKRRRGLN